MFSKSVWNKIKLLWGLMTGKAKMTDRGDTAIVCVGMQISSKYGACPGSQLDSDSMASILSRYGNVQLMQNKQATVSSVTSALQAAVQSKLCIFYYSGHGGQERNSKGEGGMSEFLCLNNGPLHDYDIWKIVSQAKGRVVMVFDCCHSATMFRDQSATDLKPFENTGFSFEMLKGPLAMGEVNLLVWSGCPANDYSYGDNNGGVFTNGIRRGFSQSDTYNDVWDRASRAAKSQRPSRTVLGTGFDGLVFR